MKINQHHIAGVFKILFCILLLLMAFCCGYSQCNSAVNLALKFNDFLPRQGVYYYRLKQTDEDGGVRYTTILKVGSASSSSKAAIVLSPNPAVSWFTLNGADMNGAAEIRISDLSGHLLRTVK